MWLSKCGVNVAVCTLRVVASMFWILAMPLSPSCVSGISAYHFRNCRSLDELWFVRVRTASFKYGQALESKTRKIPSTLQACSFFSNPFFEFCFLTPLFLPSYCSTRSSKHSTLQKFQRIALEPEILLQWWFAWTFRKHFLLVMPFSHESEHSKLMISQIMNFSFSTRNHFHGKA